MIHNIFILLFKNTLRDSFSSRRRGRIGASREKKKKDTKNKGEVFFYYLHGNIL